jgi:phosphoserine aminotransferase
VNGTPGELSPRADNFAAGPAALPEEVLLAVRDELWSFAGTGTGILEYGHRTELFARTLGDAREAARRLLGLGEEFEILFLPGGATLHFAMVPMNFLAKGTVADHLLTGTWPRKCLAEAKKVGATAVAFDGTSTAFDHVPDAAEIRPAADAAYLHYCSNNTVEGTQFAAPPASDAPLVCDMTGDLFTRRFPHERHALTYAAAQKNLGPSGAVLAIARKNFLARANPGLPTMLSYAEHAKAGSVLNTPNVFAVHVMGHMFRWIERNGGLTGMERRNRDKASLVYGLMDARPEFFRSVVRRDSRSMVSVPFRLPTAELERELLAASEAAGFRGLAGHHSIGGVRVSLHNAVSVEATARLVEFLEEFARRG